MNSDTTLYFTNTSLQVDSNEPYIAAHTFSRVTMENGGGYAGVQCLCHYLEQLAIK